MTDMRSENEIAELFAAANPVPTSERPGRQADRDPALAVAADSDAYELDPHPVDSASDSRREPWLLVAGVAAVVALVVSLLATSIRGTDSPAPADGSLTPPTLAEPTSSSVTPLNSVNAAENFIAALNDRDLASMLIVSADDLEVDGFGIVGVDEVPWLLRWFDAFDWRYEEGSCETGAELSRVVCRGLSLQNRLTDLTGLNVSADFYFTMDRGEIQWVGIANEMARYSREAFEPFGDWVEVNDPSGAERMWTVEPEGLRPVLSADSIALFDENLTGYESAHASGIAQQFIEALSARDLDALLIVSADDLRLDGFGTGGVKELSEQLDFYETFDWRWEEVACEVGRQPSQVSCETTGRNRLSDLSGNARSVTFTLSIDTGRVASGLVSRAPSVADEPGVQGFITWIESNHPGDWERMFADGEPLLGAESVSLWGRRLSEYEDTFGDDQ